MGELESMTKGRAIHRPEGWIVSSRTKLMHLTEGKMTEQEYIAFDYLLHLAGWDKRKENYGKVPKNRTHLQREWFTFWSRPTLIKALKGLLEKRYIQEEGEWIVIPNFARHQDKSSRNTVNDFDSEPEAPSETVNSVDTDCQRGLQQLSTPLTVSRPQTSTTSESCEPKPINQLKPSIITPFISPTAEVKANSMSEKYESHFQVLKSVANYPFDPEKDAAMLDNLAANHPTLDLVKELRNWANRKLDDPITKKTKPRSQISTWMAKAQQFAEQRQAQGYAGPKKKPSVDEVLDAWMKGAG